MKYKKQQSFRDLAQEAFGLISEGKPGQFFIAKRPCRNVQVLVNRWLRQTLMLRDWCHLVSQIVVVLLNLVNFASDGNLKLLKVLSKLLKMTQKLIHLVFLTTWGNVLVRVSHMLICSFTFTHPFVVSRLVHLHGLGCANLFVMVDLSILVINSRNLLARLVNANTDTLLAKRPCKHFSSWSFNLVLTSEAQGRSRSRLLAGSFSKRLFGVAIGHLERNTAEQSLTYF